MNASIGFVALISAALSTAASAANPVSPQIFARGVISMPFIAAAPTFSPDDSTVYFWRAHEGRNSVYTAHKQGETWSTPIEASFSHRWLDIEPAMSPDGSYMIFASNRPVSSKGKPLDGAWEGKDYPALGGNLWRVDRSKGGWSAPRRLPSIVNDDPSVFTPTIASDGTLYFMKPGADTHFHIFTAHWNGKTYGSVERLPFFKDGVTDDDPTVAHDNSYLVFGSNRDNPKQVGLYVVIRNKDGGWSAPMALPGELNGSAGKIIEPRLSADENTLYFGRNGSIWSVRFADIREQLRTSGKVSAGVPAAQLFAPGVISMPVNVAAPAFAPDGAAVYFQRGDGLERTIDVSRRQGDTWTTPAAAPFATQWMNIEPAYAPGGSYMIFASDRPVDASGKALDWAVGGKVRAGRGCNLWRVDRSGDGWSAPRRLPSTINDGPAIFAPAVTGDGTLFFMKDVGGGTFHLFEARANGNSYESAKPLPFSNDGVSDIDSAVAKDGSYIVFGSDRDASAKSNAYIAFRTSAGWTAPVHLPDDLSIGQAIEFRFSPDEKTLYFSRDGSIWSVPFAAVREQLRVQIKQ